MTCDEHPQDMRSTGSSLIYVDGIISHGTGLMVEPYTNLFGLPDVPEDGFAYFAGR